MEIKRLNSHFGAEVLGVDLRDSENNDLIRTLTQVLYENRVIIIRNQSLTEDNYLKFGRQWGAPIPPCTRSLTNAAASSAHGSWEYGRERPGRNCA